MPAGLPRVVAHNAISLDGRIDGFEVDLAQFYSLASTWREDVTLTGADTILASPGEEADTPQTRVEPPADGDDRALLSVVDSRARVHTWGALAGSGYWRGVQILASESTPPSDLARLRAMGVDVMVAGRDRVDLRAALLALQAERWARVVRVDSGGGLLGALLREGLVDELSLLVHPVVAGPDGRLLCREASPSRWRLMSAKRVGELVWLRYER